MRTFRDLLPALVLTLPAFTSGCVVYANGGPPAVDRHPEITYADAGCYWDNAYGDYVWYFEADATDPNGSADVVEVYADVYDIDTGDWVDGFDLTPDIGVTWYSAWVGSTTYLDCTQPIYSVDLTAVDRTGLWDVVTVDPVQEL